MYQPLPRNSRSLAPLRPVSPQFSASVAGSLPGFGLPATTFPRIDLSHAPPRVYDWTMEMASRPRAPGRWPPFSSPRAPSFRCPRTRCHPDGAGETAPGLHIALVCTIASACRRLFGYAIGYFLEAIGQKVIAYHLERQFEAYTHAFTSHAGSSRRHTAAAPDLLAKGCRRGDGLLRRLPPRPGDPRAARRPRRAGGSGHRLPHASSGWPTPGRSTCCAPRTARRSTDGARTATTTTWSAAFVRRHRRGGGPDRRALDQQHRRRARVRWSAPRRCSSATTRCNSSRRASSRPRTTSSTGGSPPCSSSRCLPGRCWPWD